MRKNTENVKNEYSSLDILGVRIDNLSKSEILERVNHFLADGKFHQISTVGPEFILKAQKYPEYKEILNNCDLNVADGFGIKLAFWRYGKKLKARFAGIDLMLEMLKIAENRELGVFLVCREGGLSSYKETRDAILNIYPKLIIEGASLDINANKFKIKNSKLKILLCSFGAPYQEIFLNSLKNDIIGVAMGVGGSFDFITGKVKRAPRFLCQIGLEWLWRLLQQPWAQKGKRFKRIWNAVIIFPIKVIFSK